MKKVSNFCFIPGHVYIFSSTSADCEGEAWGIFDKWVEEAVFLEVMTFDMKYYLTSCQLPSRYRFVREAVHEEVRDFAFNLGATVL